MLTPLYRIHIHNRVTDNEIDLFFPCPPVGVGSGMENNPKEAIALLSPFLDKHCFATVYCEGKPIGDVNMPGGN